MKRILAALAVVAMAAAIPTISSATPTECDNQTITGTVNGGLTVSDNDNCKLDGAIIHGGIVMTGGTLTVGVNNHKCTIDGGIDMTAGTLIVCGSRINGGIFATGGRAVEVGGVDDEFLSGECNCNRIDGNTDVSGITGLVEFDSNLINGGLDLNSNGIPTSTEVEVEKNDIQGPLNCVGNASVTDNGKPNSWTAGPVNCPPLSKVPENEIVECVLPGAS
jgi:hypothetical protein